ncbi:MAG: hypothetical protein HKN54_00790 [Flavobacteriaceae bacterium]|nr:hypothetical protein [Flavobacteriaceae bacterium]
MKENTEQHLDKLTKKIIGSMPLETPSSNFTSSVMTQIEGLDAKSIVHQPLISRRAWFIVALIGIAFIAFNIFGNVESLGWFESVDFGVLTDNKISESLSGITISKTLLYSAVMFGVFMLIQITVLKNYFDKRLQF